MSQNPAENLYSARSPYPPTYIRGRANATSLPIYRDGALVVPTSGTYTLYDAGGAVVVTGAVTVAGSTATFALTSTHLPATAELSAAYQETWSLVFSDRTQVFDREIIVARRALHPVITDLDLQAVYQTLDRDRPASLTSFQAYIDEAWKRILSKLIGRGIYPHRIMSAEALRAWHTDLALGIFFADAARAQSARGNYLELHDRHMKAADAAWSELTLHMDNDEDGKVDDVRSRTAAARIVHLNAAPAGASSVTSGRW